MTETKTVMVRRRTFLKGAAAVGLALAAPAIITRRGYAADAPTVVNSIRSLTNPYHATWNKGGEAFAKSVGAEYVTLVTEGNSEKGIADIKAILAKTGGNFVINVDPNDSPDARPIVEACKAAGAYVVTQWNKPADLHPWDHDPNYVAHISFSGVPYGKAMAEALIKAMGGKGGIVALGGIEFERAGDRAQGRAERGARGQPDVKLLDMQVANWSATEALEKTNAWLTQFGDEIGGIWAANDDMALAAVEALRAEGRAGQVPVTGIDGIQLAVEAILKPARWPARSPGIRSGRAAWASRSATTPRPGRSTRPRSPRSIGSSTAPACRSRRRTRRSSTTRTSRRSRSSTGTTSGAASAGRSSTAEPRAGARTFARPLHPAPDGRGRTDDLRSARRSDRG